MNCWSKSVGKDLFLQLIKCDDRLLSNCRVKKMPYSPVKFPHQKANVKTTSHSNMPGVSIKSNSLNPNDQVVWILLLLAMLELERLILTEVK